MSAKAHHLNYHSVHFLKSALRSADWVTDQGREVAFAGRSNAGKSSAINALTQQSHLAKVSKMPGRTQCINFFAVNDQCRLVDLPGYGYANVPPALKQKWHRFIDEYFQTRESLCGIVLIMDIRRDLGDFENELIAWANASQLPVHILLTKADKLSYRQQMISLKEKQKTLEGNQISLSLFSATENIGRKELESQLDEWFVGAKETGSAEL